MEAHRLGKLLKNLLEGSISSEEYGELKRYLSAVLRRTSQKLAKKLKEEMGLETFPNDILHALQNKLPLGEEAVSYAVEEFVLLLLRKKEKLMAILESGENVGGYISVMVRNHLLDLYRSLSSKVEIVSEEDLTDEGEREHQERTAFRKNPEDYLRSLRRIELAELEELVLKTLKQDELKYLCYYKDSRRYKCLWGGKSEGAIYQDIRRNGKRVLRTLGEVLSDMQVSEELFTEFSKTLLSERCEKLRLKICKENVDENP